MARTVNNPNKPDARTFFDGPFAHEYERIIGWYRRNARHEAKANNAQWRRQPYHEYHRYDARYSAHQTIVILCDALTAENAADGHSVLLDMAAQIINNNTER